MHDLSTRVPTLEVITPASHQAAAEVIIVLHTYGHIAMKALEIFASTVSLGVAVGS